MFAVRLGSYSMCATLALTPSLSWRRKSMTRKARLCPPPLCRVVMRPWLLRPPVLCSGLMSDFSGVDRVISAKSETLEPRRPGVVGLYLRIAMSLLVLCSQMPDRLSDRSSEDLDGLAFGGKGHERALGALALAVTEPGPLALALTVGGVDVRHLHTEDLLNGDLD